MGRKKLKDQVKSKKGKNMSEEKKQQAATEEEVKVTVEEAEEEVAEVGEEVKKPVEDKQEEKKMTEEEKLSLEVSLWKDKYLRNMAEFDNFRRRSIKEKSDWLKNSNERILLEICDVIDNFERAMTQLKEEQKDDPFIKGVLQIEQQLNSLLVKENIVKIETEGKEFDPSIHEALAHIPSDEAENTVVATIQNGYKLNDKVVRAARVAVSNGQPVTPKK